MSMPLTRNRRAEFVTIFFDLEGRWGSPFSGSSNLDDTIGFITEALEQFGVPAVFNVCGKIIEERPGLIQKLCSDGHEIASHAYAHENILYLSPKELDYILSKTERAFEDAVGGRISGIRPPNLMSRTGDSSSAPRAINEILKQISDREYKWISFRKIVFPEEFAASLRFTKTYDQLGRFRRRLLSAKVSLDDKVFSRTPKLRGNMLDIPLTSSMDCDILGIPAPNQPSENERVETFIWSIQQQFLRSGPYFNLNFHPWVIGNSNRQSILIRTLEFIERTSKCHWVLPREIVRMRLT